MKLSEILVATKSEDGLVLYEYRGLEYNSHPESLLDKTYFWKLHNFTLLEDRITHMTVSRPRSCPECKVIYSCHMIWLISDSYLTHIWLIWYDSYLKLFSIFLEPERKFIYPVGNRAWLSEKSSIFKLPCKTWTYEKNSISRSNDAWRTFIWKDCRKN